ncbi:5-methylcytosine-specific restriction protein B [Catenulispora sp. GAS73]|uniref:AAA family ATPase n=1 Tax=Catenulispora sp. GAS73 TaxID=3156269 RepID=UPI003516728C
MPEYPEFQLRLPNNGPIALGRLLDERGTNGSKRFILTAHSPVRHMGLALPTYETEMLVIDADEDLFTRDLVESGTYPGCLETTRDLDFGSPGAAAEFVTGSAANSLARWQTADGRPLQDFMDVSWQGPRTAAWLVRGSNVNGLDLVTRMWLPDGFVSLSASRLRSGIDGFPSKEMIRSCIEEDYDTSATYNQKVDLTEAIHAFLARMKPGHTVVTISGGQVWMGTISSDAIQMASDGGRSNLRRAVEWAAASFDFDGLPDDVQARLSDQHEVVDLTGVADLIDALRTEPFDDDAVGVEAAAETVELPVSPLRELELPDFDQDVAERLHVDLLWLTEVRQLLEDEKQIVFYGPPGTGKTYLAQALAEHLAGGTENVELVQFHPSYAYEDFFEGFRPREDDKSGEVAFRLTAGPLRDIAERASREGNRHVPYFLIIDELNRANLAKVFGELYFLLEYRKRSVRLTYSTETFFLPQNLFIIGTMNTADRSIALVDAAMRRRFSFVELSPDAEPTAGLLRRWLVAEGHDLEPALLLDELNRRIDDKDFRIGPSYLMKKGVYRDGGLERAWRTKILPLLEEHHYGEGVDIGNRYGLPALRRALARAEALEAGAASATHAGSDDEAASG